MIRSPSATGNALLLATLALSTCLVMLVAGHQASHRLLLQEAAQLRPQLTLYANAIEGVIERYRALPAVLALDPQLRQALNASVTPEVRAELNLKLEKVNGAAATSTLTLINATGHAVAASNWRLPQTNVGHDYSFRPYYRQLAYQDDGRFYGIGFTTGIPGYFLSKALRETSGKLIGALVIKVDLRDVERQWIHNIHTVLVSDANGVVFLSSDPAWRYTALTPLTPVQHTELDTSQQYSSRVLRPLKGTITEHLQDDVRRMQIDMTGIAGDYLWESMPLTREGWTLHALDNTRDNRAVVRVTQLAAAGVWLTAVFLTLFLRQRVRIARLRRRSREELEEMVRQHAEVLRTAQDSLVQAASLATLGQAENLEHLPQGVSVVDAQLRLTACNKRYKELFRLPADLTRAGRPIEDILRYNARRGLMGSGDVEDSVRRRLEHLRAGNAYVFERERPDGTVLEIRGNPLPGGGFVTSYADITTYKSAARDLRTLATTLEQRVEQRTQELQEAKREAERANRSKTRFVTAAIHDLQQPLHAARMYASAMRERLIDPETTTLARNVEESLAVQNSILTGLLDIARLESGTIPTQIGDLPLGELFATLGREFGILAQAKGLKLRCLKTRSVVRSDEALLRRILQNFLSNAIRYTQRGGVLLGCRRRGNALRIEVWDTGPGIPERHWREIFDEFRRLNTTAELAQGGLGLGLAIVDRIARLLGHSVELRSQVGRGTVFSLTLPIGEATRVLAAPHDAPVSLDNSLLYGRNVWCIDDDSSVREAISALLTHWGCHVVTASGADDGIPLAHRAPGAPDLLILDYHLGKYNGPEVLSELSTHWRRPIRVILVTAHRDPILEETARDRGWGFLYKPVRPPALRALMKQLLVRTELGSDSAVLQ